MNKIGMLIILIGYLAISSNIFSQEHRNIRFEHLTVDDGLSSNTVAASIQDSKGFLWVATTNGGLNKYDGSTFSQYLHNPEDSSSLSDNNTWRFYLDSQDNLWIVTWGGGLSRYDDERDAFVNYTHNDIDTTSISHNWLWDVLVDTDEQLWVATDAGLDKYDPNIKGFTHYRNTPEDATSISNDKVSALVEGNDGVLWVGTYGGGLNRFDTKTNSFTCFRHLKNEQNSLVNDFIWIMRKDSEGIIWIATEGGLSKFNPSSETFTNFTHDESNPNSISDGLITAIFQDSKGRLWVGTDGHGVNLYRPSTQSFQKLFHERSNLYGLADNAVWDIFEDNTGTLWFSTFNGLDKYDSERSKFTTYQHVPGFSQSLGANSVQAFCSDDDGNLWIGTRGGGLSRFDTVSKSFTNFLHVEGDDNTIQSNTILDIAKDSEGILWLGTNVGMDRFDPKSETFTHYQHDPENEHSISRSAVWDIEIDAEGFLWIGTHGGGLNQFDPSSGNFTHYTPDVNNPNSLLSEWIYVVTIDSLGNIWTGADGSLSRLHPKTGIVTNFLPEPGNPNGLSDGSIHTIYEDSQGVIWVGTNRGINRFDSHTETFAVYNTSDGIAGDMVASIIEDNSGVFWLGTNKGLSKFDVRKNTCRNYDLGDGLQGNQFRRKAVFKSNDGQLFFGGTNGFSCFFPDKVFDNTNIPAIVLTDFQLFNKSVGIGDSLPLQKSIHVADQIVLDHDQSVFTIEFASLNFRNSHKNQYAYKMEGFDNEWTYVDNSRRFATYTNLDPGVYTFKVKGTNNDGLWNEEGTTIEIVVNAPWWKTRWFIATVILFLLIIVLSVLWYVKLLTSEIIERKQAERAIRKANNNSKISGLRYKHLFENNPVSLWEEDFTEVKKLLKTVVGKTNDIEQYIEDNESFVYQCASVITVVNVNEETLRLFQYESKEDIINNLSSTFNDISFKTFKKLLVSIAKGEGLFIQETEYVKKDGSTISAIVHIISTIEEANSIVAIVDTTMLKSAEIELVKKYAELQSSEEELQASNEELLYEKERAEQQELLLRLSTELGNVAVWEYSFLTNTMSRSQNHDALYGLEWQETWNLDVFNKQVHPDDKEISNALIGSSVAKGGSDRYNFDFRVITSDNTVRWLSVVGQVVKRNSEGVGTIVRGCLIDCTDRKNYEIELKKNNARIAEQNNEYEALNEELRHANEELYNAKVKAEESDLLKTEFINNMSHEIRTPMNGIIGFSKFLSDEKLSENSRNNYVKIIQNSGYQLLRIIDDILEISRLGTKQVELLESDLCLNDFLLEQFSIFDVKAKEQKIPLYLKKSLSNNESVIRTDEVKLQKIISNLLENALKFTHEGHIEFGYVMKKVHGDTLLEIYVQDTGIGIAKDKYETIFERFSQEEKDLSMKAGGLGLGLSIAKENAELLGGEILLSSEKGKGSIFSVLLPYKPVSTGVSYAESTVPQQSVYTVLIVEDEEVNFLYLEALLYKIDDVHCSIIHASNGAQAIDICTKNTSIDIILMDLKMPIMTGFEATSILKKEHPDIPIIAQTAYSTVEDEKRAYAAGCDDFISKPIDEVAFMRLMDKYLLTNK